LPVSTGGGGVVPMRFQQPYVEMLHAARLAGLRIVAIDRDGVDYDQRNECMARAVARHLADAADRAVAIVGQLHLVPRAIFGRAPSMATRLRQHLGDSIVTVGRAVPDVIAELSVWSNVADVREHCLMPVAGSPYESLGSTHGRETLRGADFDHILFYPAAAVIDTHRLP
jgi:hypothetical protein